MPEFQLFRLKVYPSEQGHLFENLTRPEILLRVLEVSQPTELRKGITWHVGKLHRLDPEAIYFRLGKTTRATVEVFREGDFVEAEYESAPYTHVLLDTRLSLTAIAQKPRLAPTPAGTARQLQRLLNEADWAKSRGHTFEIAAIKDPDSFLAYLRSGFAVRRFSATFTPPNPLDIDEDITKPFQRWLKDSNATRGKANIQGGALDVARLETVARSAAATGNEATALLTLEKDARPVKKHLTGGPVTVTQMDVDSEDEKVTLVDRVRAAYHRVSGTNGEAE
jgi:hypothetical protein